MLLYGQFVPIPFSLKSLELSELSLYKNSSEAYNEYGFGSQVSIYKLLIHDIDLKILGNMFMKKYLKVIHPNSGVLKIHLIWIKVF